MKRVYWFISFLFLLILSFGLFYNSKYFIRLNGEKELELKLGEVYVEKKAETLFHQPTKIVGSVDNTKIGTYELKYYHLKNYITRKVTVIDDIKPTITLKGDSEINIVLNSEYHENGFEAIDNYDGDITNKVKIKSELDTSVEGVYEIEYEVEDSSHNKTSVKRKINVNKNGPMALSIKDFNLNGYFTDTILKENSSDPNYLKDTIFYGDSITENFAYYQNISYDNVWARSNLTPVNAHTWEVMFYRYNEKITIVEGFKKYKPKRVIITLGANAVAIMDRNYFVSEYEKLIENLKTASPTTEIIIQSIFPVDGSWDYKINTINNTKINNLNYLLAEMCERQNIKFLNTAEILKNENGTAIQGYLYESDGIHPLPIANEKIIEYVKSHQL